MMTCHLCPQWAQWRVRKPIYDGETTADYTPKIVGWELISFLCGSHKQEQMAMPENEGLRFDFMGAHPVWPS